MPINKGIAKKGFTMVKKVIVKHYILGLLVSRTEVEETVKDVDTASPFRKHLVEYLLQLVNSVNTAD